MTSYTVEHPARRRPGSRVRPGLVHLRAGEATMGQPVTIRTVGDDGSEVEFPAVYVRTNGRHLSCQGLADNQVHIYRPSEVFPRRVEYRRWTVTLKHKAVTEDGDGNGLLPVFVNARTELEAQYLTLTQVRAKYGQRGNWSFTLHSVKRGG